MWYLQLGITAVAAIALLILFGIPIGLGLLLAIAAGLAQDIPAEWGQSVDEIVIDWIVDQPRSAFPAALARTLAGVTLSALAGGLAVPVYAAMHTVAALNDGAHHIAPAPKEDEE